MDTQQLGQYGEEMACGYLVEKGFKILGKNYRIKFGEIDIIARRKRKWLSWDTTIHFIEVKSLASLSFNPEDHVDRHKRQKLRRLAEIWLHTHRYLYNHPYQIDIIAFSIDPVTGKEELQYFPNAVSGDY